MNKVAIDTGPLNSEHNLRGIGVHTRQLVEELLKINDPEVKIEGVDFSKTDLSKYDIVHYTSFNPYFFSLPFKKPANRVVLTIHDLIYLIYPSHYPPGIRGTLKFWLQRFLINNVDRIITISETSKKDICHYLPIHPDKVDVIYLAPKEIFKPIKGTTTLQEVKTKYNLPDQFVLYVGDINYNKNIPTLIDGCETAKIPLVLVGKHARDLDSGEENDLKTLRGPQDYLRYLLGKPHPELAHYSKLLGKMRKANVLRLGFVPDKDLSRIFNLATLYCQPSYYEGFGLGILEAMASGVPVVASKTQSLVEIAEEAALFADPKDKEDFAKKIIQLKDNSSVRSRLIKSGYQTVKKFSWYKTAKETLEVYKKLI